MGGVIAEIQAIGKRWIVATIDGIDRELGIVEWHHARPALLSRPTSPARPPLRRLQPGTALVSRSAGSIRILAAGGHLYLIEWSYNGRRQRHIFTRLEIASIVRRGRRDDRFVSLVVVSNDKHERKEG